MNKSTTTAVLDELWDPVGRCLTLDVAKSIAQLRAPKLVQQKLEQFAEKSTEGTLTLAERTAYETYVRSINVIGISQAQARAIIAAQAAN